MRAKIAFSIVFAASLTLGCGGEDAAPDDGETAGGCAEPDGVYRSLWSERNGDCGEPTTVEQIASFGSNEPSQAELRADESCSGRQELADNGCTIEIDTTCDLIAAGEQFIGEYVGAITWDQSASSAEGIVQMTLRDAHGGWLCSSTYNVTYERI